MKKNLWIIVLGIIAVATIIIIYLLRTPDKTRIVYCGPNQTDPATVFINPDEAFPAFATAYTVGLTAGVNFLDTLSKAADNINAGSDIKTQIVKMREDLNQENIEMENVLKAAFYSLNARPCNLEVVKQYNDIVATISSKIKEIDTLKSTVVLPETSNPQPQDSIPSAKEISKDTAKIRKAIFQYNKKISTLQLKNPRIRVP
jgi:hypothetical protein